MTRALWLVMSRPWMRTEPLDARRRPGDGLDELALSVARHAGDPDDLAAVDGERHVAHGQVAAIARDGEPLDLEHQLAPGQRALAEVEDHVAAHHHAGELAAPRLSRIGAAYDAALAQHDDAGADAQDLLELVADEDDGVAFACHPIEDPEQVLRLGRREHRRRLVEDQEVGALEERLEDLDALLLPGRQLPDPAARSRPRGRSVGRTPRACARSRAAGKSHGVPR